MSLPSVDDLVAAKCPADKPHKCPPYAVCYGRYYYCYATSKNAEPCISETILMDPDSRKKLCQDIVDGKNVTELVRNPACTLAADCFDEFQTLFYPSTEGVTNLVTDDDDTTCLVTCVLAICFGIVTVLLVAATLAAVILAIFYRKQKAKRNKNGTKERKMPGSNNDIEAGSMYMNNIKNEQRLLEKGNQSQQTADLDQSDTGSNTDSMALLRHKGNDAANALNPPDSGRVTGPPVIATTMIDIDAGVSSGSVSYRNSHHSLDNPSASSGSDPPEENRPSTSSNMTLQEEHPAEVEHTRQRGMHMPSSEPSGAAQLVINHTAYFRAHDGRLE